MKLTRFIFSRRFEAIVTPLSSDKYLQVLEFKTDSVQSSSNKCKNYLLKIYSQHINLLNTI